MVGLPGNAHLSPSRHANREVVLLPVSTLLWMLVCCCRLVKMKGQYPELILQRRPSLVTIMVSHLIVYLSQGPPPVQHTGNSSNNSSSSVAKQLRVVVCHSDLAVPNNTALKYNGLVASSTLPHPVVCCSKLCVSPKCLHYATQAQNAMTGNHHRTQLNKKRKQFGGSECDPFTCVKCSRHVADKHRRLMEHNQPQAQQQQQ